jgi:hypothetical protein
MKRKMLQSALCVCLSPLLAAQQATDSGKNPATPDIASATQPKATAITLPRKTIVQLVLMETVSSATAQKGQTVRLVVRKNVVVNGTVVIPRGTPASGLVTFASKGVAGKSDGKLQVEPLGLTLPDESSIGLRGYIDDGGDGVCEGFVNCLGLIVVAIPMSVPFAVASGVASLFQRHHAPEPGIDQTLAPCWTLWSSTKTKSRINRAIPDKDRISPPATDVDIVCSGHAVSIPSLRPALPQGTMGVRTMTAP